MPTPRSFDSLPPEILRMVCALLSPCDRAHCVRLNKRLHANATPFLWEWLRIKTPKHLRHFRTKNAQQAFSRNAAFVRRLDITRETFSFFLPQKKALPARLARSSWNWSRQASWVEYLPAACTNLRELHLGPGSGQTGIISYARFRDMFTQDEEDAIIDLLQQNPTLTSLVIGHVDMRIKPLLQITTQELSNLEYLKVKPYITPWTAKAMLEALPETIKYVSLQVNIVDGSDKSLDKFQQEAAKAFPPRNTHPAMESLEIDWMWRQPPGEDDDTSKIEIVGKREEKTLLRFLESCSQRPLKFSVGYTTACFCNERLRRALDRLGAECVEVDLSHLSSTTVYTDSDFADILQSGSRWVDIDLFERDVAGPHTAAAILERCEYLQRLDIASCPKISSKDICAILGTCETLESLIAIDWSVPEPARHPRIEGADLVEVKWACATSLKWWACMITVPRPATNNSEEHVFTNNGSINDNNDVIESHKIQRQVYRKLGELTRLQALCLGRLDDGKHRAKKSWVQRQSLEMSLESGLDELKCLRELEVLDVSYLDHRIDLREVKWMEENWPRVETVTALFRTCSLPVPEARTWVKSHHPEWISPGEERDGL